MSTESSQPSTSSIPPEVVANLAEFNKAMTELEEALEKHFAIPFEQHLERPALEMARVDVMSQFTLSSLGYCIAAMKGQDPNENAEIRGELNRTKEYYARFKTLESRKQAPRVNQTAAKNFVRNALWEVPPTDQEGSSTEQSTANPGHPAPKRKNKKGANK